MRSPPLLLLLLLSLLALPLLAHEEESVDTSRVNTVALTDETKPVVNDHKLDCRKDIGVAPLDSLRHVKPHYQIFILDLTTSEETFSKIRLLFIHAVCLYAAASNHIRIGYIALVNKHKVSSEPSIPDIREFIGMWTEPDEKLLGGMATARQEHPLTHCERAELLGHIINRFSKMTKKPFRFLIIDDQKADDSHNQDCDQAYEFAKALHRRNISLDNFILDEVVSRDQNHGSGRRMSKAPIFTVGSLDDQEGFMAGMQSYIEGLQKPEPWKSDALKSMVEQSEELNDEPEYSEPEHEKDVVIEFPTAAHSLSLKGEENMTAAVDFDDDEGEQRGVKKAVRDVVTSAFPSSTSTSALNSSSSSLPPPSSSTTTADDVAVGPPVPLAIGAAPIGGEAVETSTEFVSTTTNATEATTTAVAAAGMRWDPLYLIPILIALLIIAAVLFVVFCCWYDKKKLKTKLDKPSNASIGTASSDAQRTPLLGVSSKHRSENSSGSSSKRPLRLTKSHHVVEGTPEGVGAPIVEKNLPDPYSPVKYINTPVPMPSDIEMTHTEHVAPPTMDEALNKHVVTPMEKVPELHIDEDYGHI